MTIIFSAATYLVAIIIVAAADYSLLRRYIPSLGFISVLMYGVTYGLGLMLWRSDPSSLFGYGSLSTIGALDAPYIRSIDGAALSLNVCPDCLRSCLPVF